MVAPAWTLPPTSRDLLCFTAISNSTWISASRHCCATRKGTGGCVTFFAARPSIPASFRAHRRRASPPLRSNSPDGEGGPVPSMRPHLPVVSPQGTDAEMLEGLRCATFDYFRHEVNPRTGLIADKTQPGSPSSIAALG